MSATDYGCCPQCWAKHLALIAEKKAALATAYGVLPLAEFDALRSEVQALEAKHYWDTDFVTMREDYNGVGVDENGVFSITYIASCDCCPFEYKFKAEEIAFKQDAAR